MAKIATQIPAMEKTAIEDLFDAPPTSAKAAPLTGGRRSN